MNKKCFQTTIFAAFPVKKKLAADYSDEVRQEVCQASSRFNIICFWRKNVVYLQQRRGLSRGTALYFMVFQVFF